MGTTESSLYHDGAPPSHLQQQNVQRPSHPRSASVAGTPRRPIRRARHANITTLNGLVLGLTGSGKRTLLQRLEGKDPFVDVDGSNNSNEDPPRDITVPYQPPPNTTVWDRIQLHVELKPNEEVPADFCVVLVNPRHDARSLRPYIAKLVSMLVKQTAGTQRPLCLCFLLNFRDLQGDRYTRIQCQDVEKWANEILQQQNVTERVILQCGTTSLKNCYGLSSLHHFIYRSYLIHKQVELEQRLSAVKTHLNKAEEVPSTEYAAFLQVLKQTAKVEATEVSSKKKAVNIGARSEEPADDAKEDVANREVRERDRRKSKTEGKEPVEATDRQQQPRRSRNQQQKGTAESSRSILPKTYADPKQTLDAFFADDDDDEEDVVTPVTSHHARDKQHMSDNDDDDDDDFFYDEGGHRHQHGVVVDSSSDEDEASVESLDSQLAHARKHSIIDDDGDESGVGEPAEAENTVVSKQSARIKGAINEATTADSTVGEGGEDKDGSEIYAQEENDVGGGWDDDDIDISDEDQNESSAGEAKSAEAANHNNEKDVGNGSGSQDGEGWNDDDDLDLESDAEPETDVAPPNGNKPSAAVENRPAKHTDKVDVVKDGAGDEEPFSKDVGKEQSSEMPNVPTAESTGNEPVHNTGEVSPPSDQEVSGTEVKGSSDKVTEPTKTAVAPKAVSHRKEDDSKDDDDDDDDIIVGDTTTTSSLSAPRSQPVPPKVVAKVKSAPGVASTKSTTQKAASRQAQDDSSDDDDDDFIVEDTTTTSPLLSRKDQSVSSKTVTKEEPSHPVVNSSSGISAAALAAIAAAEREAQLMMHEQTTEEAHLKAEKKKSKKKKDPDAKKKKKKHKEKRRSSGE